MKGNLINRRRGKAALWILAVVVIALIAGAVVYLGQRESDVIGRIGMLGAPPQTFEPLLAVDGLQITDNQRSLEFNDGSRIIAETGTVLNLGAYSTADHIDVESGLIYHEAAGKKAISMAAGPLGLSSLDGRIVVRCDSKGATVDVLGGKVKAATREVAPGLSVVATSGEVTPVLRRHADKIDWIGRLVSDPARVRPDVADTNLPGSVSGMVIMADTWAPQPGAIVRLYANTGDSWEPAPTTADAAGRFAFSKLEGAEWVVLAKAASMINLEELGGLYGMPKGVVVVGRGPHLRLVQLHLAQGTEVKVVQESEDGPLPAVGATVVVTGDEATLDATREVKITETQPTFTVVVWPDRSVRVNASKPGFHTAMEMVDAAAPSDRLENVTLTLVPGPTADATTRDATGSKRLLPSVRRLP